MRLMYFCLACILLSSGCASEVKEKAVESSDSLSGGGKPEADLIDSTSLRILDDSSLTTLDSSLINDKSSIIDLPALKSKKAGFRNESAIRLKEPLVHEASSVNYFEQAIKKFNQKDWAGAIPLFDKELGINPSNAEAFDKRKQALAELAKQKADKQKSDKDKADKDKAAKEKDANSQLTRLDSLMHDAQYKFNVSDYAGAIRDYTTIIDQKLSTNCEVYYKRGLTKAEYGKNEAAILDFNKAIELFPSYSDAYYRRGLCRIHLERPKEALSDFSQVIKLHPKDKIGYFNRGLTKGLIKDYKGAVQDFSKSIEIDSLYEDAYFHRAESNGSLGSLEEAIKDLTFVIKLNNHSKLAYYNRGQYYLEEQLYDEAAADFSKVVQLNPSDAEAHYFKGLAEMELDNKNEACASLEKASELGDKRAAFMMEKQCKKKKN
jgi:tetratricopeptide (TPR) repeat protein